MGIPLGLVGRATMEVTDDDTAVAHRSGDVPVLATPRLVSLCEEACCRAVADRLEPGLTTVGMRVQLDHLAPTALGVSVTAEATLDRAEGRRLAFTLSASDARGLVGAGRMTRVVIERETFLERAR